MTRRANRKKRLTVLYIVEHPNQEGDTCIDWTSQYCWTNGGNCLWRGHSVYRNRPLIPPDQDTPPAAPQTGRHDSNALREYIVVHRADQWYGIAVPAPLPTRAEDATG